VCVGSVGNNNSNANGNNNLNNNNGRLVGIVKLIDWDTSLLLSSQFLYYLNLLQTIKNLILNIVKPSCKLFILSGLSYLANPIKYLPEKSDNITFQKIGVVKQVKN
jgi:hypothetical protein